MRCNVKGCGSEFVRLAPGAALTVPVLGLDGKPAAEIEMRTLVFCERHMELLRPLFAPTPEDP